MTSNNSNEVLKSNSGYWALLEFFVKYPTASQFSPSPNITCLNPGSPTYTSMSQAYVLQEECWAAGGGKFLEFSRLTWVSEWSLSQ